MISQKQIEIITELTKKFNPCLLGVFGSYARGDHAADSDLDVLADFEQKTSLLDHIGLEQELSEKLGVKVDLVTRNSLHPGLKPFIEKDLIRII